jgi:hypothetical protein
MEISLLPGCVVLEKICIQPSTLVQQVPLKQLDHYIAVINWLTDYQTHSGKWNVVERNLRYSKPYQNYTKK